MLIKMWKSKNTSIPPSNQNKIQNKNKSEKKHTIKSNQRRVHISLKNTPKAPCSPVLRHRIKRIFPWIEEIKESSSQRNNYKPREDRSECVKIDKGKYHFKCDLRNSNETENSREDFSTEWRAKNRTPIFNETINFKKVCIKSFKYLYCSNCYDNCCFKLN